MLIEDIYSHAVKTTHMQSLKSETRLHKLNLKMTTFVVK